jgi:hypothetical protein
LNLEVTQAELPRWQGESLNVVVTEFSS